MNRSRQIVAATNVTELVQENCLQLIWGEAGSTSGPERSLITANTTR